MSLNVMKDGSLINIGYSGAIDQTLSTTSNNAIANKAATTELNKKQNVTDNNLNTTAKTVVGAINEHESDITQINTDLTNKVDKFKTKTISNATTNNYCAIPLELESSRVINIQIENHQYVAFLMSCGNGAYAAVYSNAPGYSTPVYNTNIGTLHITYI